VAKTNFKNQHQNLPQVVTQPKTKNSSTKGVQTLTQPHQLHILLTNCTITVITTTPNLTSSKAQKQIAKTNSQL